MTEAELRELGGARPAITFLGQDYSAREDGLAALIRFARAATTDDPEQPVPVTALYGLIEDCLPAFTGFEAAAIAGRAAMDDISKFVNDLVSWYCCRSHWPAMRLIGFISGNLEEIDGQLIRAGGRGITSLSPREACNVALAVCLEGRDEDDREAFLEDLNYEGDATSDALAQLRKMQAEQKAAAGG
jgi:hypothetical protein